MFTSCDLSFKTSYRDRLPGQEARGSSSNPFLSLLNGLGIFGAGVLGALYALARKEKKETDEILQSVGYHLPSKSNLVVQGYKLIVH